MPLTGVLIYRSTKKLNMEKIVVLFLFALCACSCEDPVLTNINFSYYNIRNIRLNDKPNNFKLKLIDISDESILNKPIDRIYISRDCYMIKESSSIYVENLISCEGENVLSIYSSFNCNDSTSVSFLKRELLFNYAFKNVSRSSEDIFRFEYAGNRFTANLSEFKRKDLFGFTLFVNLPQE